MLSPAVPEALGAILSIWHVLPLLPMLPGVWGAFWGALRGVR